MNFREMLLAKHLLGSGSGGNTGGGGDAVGGVKMTYGKFSIAGWPGSSTYEFEHGLGSRPSMFAIFQINGSSRVSYDDILFFVAMKYGSQTSSNGVSRILHGQTSTSGDTIVRNDPLNSDLANVFGIKSDNQKITINMTEKNILMVNAVEHYWVAFSEEALA